MSRNAHKRSDKRQVERAVEQRRREKEQRETRRKRDGEPEPTRGNGASRPPKQAA
jgi:hypothetical protein